ncbi:hypothetical protein HispidOSU_004449, partial [Sigmodon hispidus]
LALGPLNALRTFLAGLTSVLGSGSLICLPLSLYEKRKLFHTPGQEKRPEAGRRPGELSWCSQDCGAVAWSPGHQKEL